MARRVFLGGSPFDRVCLFFLPFKAVIAVVIGLHCLLSLAIPAMGTASAGPQQAATTEVCSPVTGAIQVALAKLPLSFVANAGQMDSTCLFIVRGAGHTIFFTASEVAFSAIQRTEDESLASVVRLRFAGANPNPTIEGLEQLPGMANFFLGNDPAKWRTNVPTYEAVVYRELYPGIDLVYRGRKGHLKNEFLVSPGADPGMIRLVYNGVESLTLRKDGALVLETQFGELIEAKPVVYQEIKDRRVEVEGTYRLLGDGQVSFTLGLYDKAYPLVIDPVLAYSTYLGGSRHDHGTEIAVDAWGNAYVTGYTHSSDFPPAPGYGNYAGDADVFVAKLNSRGSALVYLTYLGGSESWIPTTDPEDQGPADDFGCDIAVDAWGNAYITGLTFSLDFPTHNALEDTFGDYCAGFLTKLDSSGWLAYSTYLRDVGDNPWTSPGIAVDDWGNAYVTGEAGADFPVTNTIGVQGDVYVFVAKLDPLRSGVDSLIYSTRFGGNGLGSGHRIAVDTQGNAYVVGHTYAKDFPTTPGAFQETGGGLGNRDAFVAKLNLTGSAFLYCTYLGASGEEYGRFDITLDGSGNAYISGTTRSHDFPTTAGAFQESFAGGNLDLFVTKLNPAGSALVYSTYLGGSSNDRASGITVDATGNVYLTGNTDHWPESPDFPTTPDALQPVYGGGLYDAFVAKLNPAGSALVYSTYLGGNGYDSGAGIAVGASGSDIYVTGFTQSSNFWTTPDALQPDNPSWTDAFVTKLSPPLSGNVVINEVAWMGTKATYYDEWIELYNTTDQTIDLTDWSLEVAVTGPDITLQGTIPAHGFFLLERKDDETVSDISADQVYGNDGSGWAFSNSGEQLSLLDATGNVIDTANVDGGGWPAGNNATKSTMERINPLAADFDANWATNDGIHRNGDDANGNPINGTPKERNSVTKPPTESLPGDVNQDGRVDVLDVRICLQIATGFLTPTAAQEAAADVDGDGDVDLADAELLAEYIIGIRDVLPACE